MAFKPNDRIISPTGSEYIMSAFLGKGTMGYIYAAYSYQFDRNVAMKFINFEQKLKEGFLRELLAYNMLSRDPYCSKNIICLLDAFELDIIDPKTSMGIPYGILVLELMQGDLSHHNINDADIPYLIATLLDGIQEMKQQQLAYQDLHLSNILYTNSTYKIADLGSMCSQYPIITSSGQSITTCNDYYENLSYEQAFKQKAREDIQSILMVLIHVIFGTFLSANIPTRYPRSEPNQISGNDIVDLLHMMRDPNITVEELREFFYSHLKYPLNMIN